MIDKALLDRFWKDFNVVVQDEDSTYPITNPQDAVKALMKCRNWVGTFTQLLLETENKLTINKTHMNTYNESKKTAERVAIKILINEGRSVAAIKNKELIESKLEFTPEALQQYLEISNELINLESDKEMLEFILKRLEKTTDWLAQYLNWIKFDLRLQT